MVVNQSGKSGKFMERMRSEYRLAISNADTFQEKWGIRLTRLNLLVALGGFFLLILVLSWVVISFTPIREFMPGMSTSTVSQQVVDNALRADSLHREVELWSNYLSNLRTIFKGGVPDSYTEGSDTVSTVKEEPLVRSEADSILRAHMEQDLKLSLTPGKGKDDLSALLRNLYPPVRGQVSKSVDLGNGHYGTDIVAKPDAPISAIADGTVVMALWSPQDGYVLAIQHAVGLLSLFKHNRQLLKRVGESVRRGDAVAIIGNSGDLSSGPHLHFELWHDGRMLNAEDYIAF